MTMRRQRREDPAYLTAMREAKELFDAEMAKNSMKGRGRPRNVVVAAPAAAVEVEIDHEVADEIVDLSSHEAEGDDAERDEAAPPRVAKQAAKPAAKLSKIAVKPSTKFAARAPARAAQKSAAKKKAAPGKTAAKRR